MTTIDGDEIEGVTIDGEEVQEITVDGDLVWERVNALQSYEDGFNGYGGATSYYYQSSSWAQHGNYSLAFDTGGSSGRKLIYNTSIQGPVLGEPYRWYFRSMAGAGQSTYHNFSPIIRVSDSNNYLFLEVNMDDSPIFRAFPVDSGSTGSSVDFNSFSTGDIAAGQTCYIDFTVTSSQLDATLYSGGSQIASISGSISAAYGNGIGHWSRDHTGSIIYDDYLINRNEL